MADLHRCLVRLKTSWWRTPQGLHERRDLLFLRRQCVGYNVMEEDAKEMSAEEVIAHCRAHMAHFKCPKRVLFADELPKNPSGKLLKRDLRRRYEAAAG